MKSFCTSIEQHGWKILKHSLFLPENEARKNQRIHPCQAAPILRLAYRLVLLEEDPAVEGEVVPVPQHHASVVIILECQYNSFFNLKVIYSRHLEIRGEDALSGLAQHVVQPRVRVGLGGYLA